MSRLALVAGAATLASLAVVAAVSTIWTPYDPTAIDLAHRLAAPSVAHVLGADPFGRDLASMLMAGAAQSLAVGVIAVLLGAAVGVPAGVLAAGRGGWVDQVVMRTADLAFAFPALLTAVMITAVAGPGAANAALAIGVFNIPVFARIARAASLGVWRRDYIQAARVAGRRELAIAVLHVLPNIAPALLVQATIQFGVAIVADAGLAYLGLGTQPPWPSWGRMLNEAQTYIHRAPRLALLPGLAITLAVLGCNLLGDGLQDVLDPRSRR